MTTLTIKVSKTENDRDAYDFTSRGTHYTVISDRDDGLFTVFSERKSAAFGLQIKVMTLAEMAARSKALSHLATIIKADQPPIATA